jgi:hypothetical protein
MEIIIFTTLIIIVFIVAFRANRNSKLDDSIALMKEIEIDFKEDFEHESAGVLSTHGMNDLVDWYEDDLRERKLEQSKDIESFNEIK